MEHRNLHLAGTPGRWNTQHPESEGIQRGSEALWPMCSQAGGGGAAKVGQIHSFLGRWLLSAPLRPALPSLPLSPFGLFLLCHLGLHHLLVLFLFSVISPQSFSPLSVASLIYSHFSHWQDWLLLAHSLPLGLADILSCGVGDTSFLLLAFTALKLVQGLFFFLV